MCDGQPFLVWYRLPASCAGSVSADNGDAFVAAFLGPAMVLGEALEIEAPVSGRLLSAGEQIQEICRCWYPQLHQVRLTAPRRALLAAGAGQCWNGLFFSLGVDSSYCLLKDLDRAPHDGAALTHRITVIGFDLYLRDSVSTTTLLRTSIGKVNGTDGATGLASCLSAAISIDLSFLVVIGLALE